MNYRVPPVRVKRSIIHIAPLSPPPPAIAGAAGAGRVAVAAVTYGRIAITTVMLPELPAEVAL
jgi:hypothetical protein